LEKSEVIDKGSNQYLEWTEELHEDEEYITFTEWGYSNKINLGPGIDDDIEHIIKIKKDQLSDLTFEKLVFVLKNLDIKAKTNKLCSFLDNRNIKYDYQVW
tara:strand:- start:341 stop:643 length:303 start_codon:yes stop_codon:yes gene_type:complete